MANREILFRGKSLYTDEGWRYGLLSRRTDISCLLNEQGKSPQHECDPETLGQYTGLTDRNGAKIFEGDVISHIGERFGVVKYYPEIGVFGFTNKPESESESDAWHFYDCQPSVFEIIGNIHDNPELLTPNQESK